MKDPRPDIEAALAARHGRRFCVLTNRGTTALTAAFHALDRPGAGVVFPGVMCSIPVYAAPFAGMKPVFADVSLETANFDLNDLESVLKTERPAAVAPLHMFGKPEDMEAVRALAERYGASVVEDVALSMSGAMMTSPLMVMGARVPAAADDASTNSTWTSFPFSSRKFSVSTAQISFSSCVFPAPLSPRIRFSFAEKSIRTGSNCSYWWIWSQRRVGVLMLPSFNPLTARSGSS